MSARRLLHRAHAGVELFGSFVYDLLASSIAVAKIVLTPDRPRMPMIVAIPVDARTEWGVALFAYLASLTPGSTALHVSDDRRTLYVHLLHAPDEHERVARMKALYEERIVRLEGWEEDPE